MEDQGLTTPTETTTEAPATWFDSLPEEYRTNESIAAYKDNPGELVKSYVDAQGKLGNALIKPADDAPEADKTAYTAKLREAMGVPADVSGYEFTPPEGLPVDEAFVTQAKQWALDAGMGKEQFAQFAAKYAEGQKVQIEAYKAQEKKDVENSALELKKEWGDKYDSNKRAALNAALKLAGQDVADWINETGMLMRTFHKVAQHISEDTLSGDLGGERSPERRYTAAGNPFLDDYNDMPRK